MLIMAISLAKIYFYNILYLELKWSLFACKNALDSVKITK